MKCMNYIYIYIDSENKSKVYYKITDLYTKGKNLQMFTYFGIYFQIQPNLPMRSPLLNSHLC